MRKAGAWFEEVYGLGMAIPESDGTARLALSLAAHKSVATKMRVLQWRKSPRAGHCQAAWLISGFQVTVFGISKGPVSAAFGLPE